MKEEKKWPRWWDKRRDRGMGGGIEKREGGH